MNCTPSNLMQLRSLFNTVCDELATDEQLQEVESLLLSDEQTRRLYLAQCQLQADLYSTICGQRSQETLRQNIETQRRRNPVT